MRIPTPLSTFFGTWCSVLAAICGVSFVLTTSTSVVGQTVDLYDQEPFDTITLKAQDEELKVVPINFPNRRLPAAPKPADKLRIRLISRPTEEFVVQWASIKSIVLYEQGVLSDAKRLIVQGVNLFKNKKTNQAQEKFDEAFQYLAFLADRYPKMQGLANVRETFLVQESNLLLAARDFERAWFLLHEVYEQNPTRRGLLTRLKGTLNQIFAARMRNKDYTDARRIYEISTQRYGPDFRDQLDTWKSQLERLGQQLLNQAESQLAAGQYRNAYLSGRRLMDLWPETPGAAELSKKLEQLYPIVIVGVSQKYAPTNQPINFPAGRRASRLLERRLFEIVAVSSEGGKYNCPFGSYTISDDGLEMQLSLDSLREQNAAVSGLTVARQLRSTTSPLDERYDPTWASQFRNASVSQIFDLTVRLHRPHLRFESLLSLSLTDNLDAEQKLSPYQVQSDKDLQIFTVNPQYLAASPTQPREIIEREVDNSQAAIQLLRKGEIDIIARLLPAEVRGLAQDKSIRVDHYRIPSMHYLIPNSAKKFTGSRAFRAALLYAIDRERILKRDLLGGLRVDGCQTVSGPFAPGIGNNDPIGYGYDPRFSIREYEPRLAKIRLQLAMIEATNAAKKNKDDPPTIPVLKIAYPNHEIAQIACREISNYWKIIGIECELVPLPLGQSMPADDDWDFLYADIQITEPITQAEFLWGANGGFARCGSAYLNLAIRKLSEADNWNEAGRRLRAIHQACYDDVSIIPLWQLVDRFAYRAEISGIGESPVQLYQNIENWQIGSE